MRCHPFDSARAMEVRVTLVTVQEGYWQADDRACVGRHDPHTAIEKIQSAARALVAIPQSARASYARC